jgi:hypothetical protein
MSYSTFKLLKRIFMRFLIFVLLFIGVMYWWPSPPAKPEMTTIHVDKPSAVTQWLVDHTPKK